MNWFLNPTSAFAGRLLAVLAVLFLLVGCRSDPPATEPEGGFLAFRSALLARDAGAVWATLSDDTHELVGSSLASLQATTELIDQLQPSDRERVREDIGAELLDSIETPDDLFRFVFLQENVPTEEAYANGLTPDTVEQSNEDLATVTTAGGQVFELQRSEDGFWRVRNPIHEQFAEAFAAMEINRANVEAAINIYGPAATEQLEIARLLGQGANEDAPDDAEPGQE